MAIKDTNLFWVNQFVDNVQNAKNQFLDVFVWDDKIKAPMKQFVEAQRDFVKQINRSIMDVTEHSLSTAKTTFEKTKSTMI